ncbi:MAG: hypothetical protein JKY65_10735 [Planctomycetes bacterium]|nr:hypothetical protein [Planctomycetota bacterium]
MHPGIDRRVVLVVVLMASALSGCASGSRALWRAGASRAGHTNTPLGLPKPSSAIATHYKEAFGPFEQIERRRHYACASTTVLSKAFLLEGSPGKPARSYSVLAEIATEEFPRDEARSWIRAPYFDLLFGVGVAPHDLFEVRLDPAWKPHALERLRNYAAQLGADAVIEVYATGDAEYHMWEGAGIGFDVRETNSPLQSAGKLLGFRLRDVRLHGLAIRYD